MQDGRRAEKPYGTLSFTIRMMGAFAVMVPLSFLYYGLCIILLPSRYARILLGNLYGKIIGRTIQIVSGITPVIRHRDRVQESAPCLYVCNHTSTMDMWIGMWLCPYGGCGVAKKEIVKVPFFGQAFWLSGHLMLDRSNRESAIASMERVRKVVQKHGLSLWMWPEGTRSKDGRLIPFKKGFVHMAISTGLPVVPVVFHDADLLWPGRTMKVTAGELHMDVLEPIDTSNWKTETAGEHAAQVWGILNDALSERQKGSLPPST